MKLSRQMELINHFSMRSPVDVIGLSAALGVEVREAFLDDDISGTLENTESGYVITVNALHPETRRRFTIAHELGHYILHRDLIGDGINDNKAYRSVRFENYLNTAIGPKQETQANQFAVSVLMPQDLIDADLAENPKISTEKMAEKYGVSRHAMAIMLDRPYER